MNINKSTCSICAIAGLIFFNACGDDVTNVYENSNPERVEKFKNLPKCDSEEEGSLIYVKDSAKVFVCDDEGWSSLNGANGKDGVDGKNGKNGNDGTSCSVETLTDGSGFKVLCGKDSVGVVKNGEDGVGCSLDDDGNGSVKVICGKGENVTETTLYKATCGINPYDPQKQFCADAKLYEFCNGKIFDPSTDICASRDTTYQLYKYVKINGKVWMSENLNYKTEKGSYCYDNKDANCAKYGRLYTWATAVGKTDETCGYEHNCKLTLPVQGICPDGWHLPSNDEFTSLVTFLGGQSVAGKKLKSAEGWDDDGSGDNSSGFTGLPGGFKSNDDSFLHAGEEGYFWSASELDDGHANSMYLSNSADVGYLTNHAKVYSFSVRCVKNDK